MPDFGIFRGFNEKLFGDKLVAGQLPTQLGLIGSEDITPIVGFVFSVDTTQSGVSTSTQFKLPLTTSTGLDCVVDWGDGTIDNITSHTATEVTHTYSSGGTYTINITGDLLGWQFNNGGDKLKMKEIKNWGALNISTRFGFYGCGNMTCTASDAPSITITDLSSYFRNCHNFNGAIGNWDVSSVRIMTAMFQGATSFNQDLNNWVTNSVVRTNAMFRNATIFNGNISNWNTSNVTNMGNMFIGTNFNQDISSWDTSNVTNMTEMFWDADQFNQPIGSWDTSSVTNMSYMFYRNDIFNQDISNWDINQVTNLTNFMLQATGLSTTNYDALLVGWEAQAPTSGININFGGSQYTAGGAAETARTSLINTYGWTITDGGSV